jgi:hypothetical protein
MTDFSEKTRNVIAISVCLAVVGVVASIASVVAVNAVDEHDVERHKYDACVQVENADVQGDCFLRLED